MTSDELKAIAGYIPEWQYNDSWGLFKKVIRPIDKINPIILDSNSAWECVQEIIKKKHYMPFEIYAAEQWLADKESELQFVFWLYNPKNFFSCFGKWCLERRGE